MKQRNIKCIEKLRKARELNQYLTQARVGEIQHKNLINRQATYTDKTYKRKEHTIMTLSLIPQVG